NTNVMSLTAQRNLNASQGDLSTAIQRLSSGLRINSAKDDAAGLAIATRMTSHINGLNQAVRNANDGISMAQTTESALGEVTNNLQRIRELAVEAANGTYSTADRAALDVEVQQRIAEIDRIASKTTFNGQNVLDGSLGSVDFQVGANVGDTVSVDFSTIDATTATLGVATINVTGATSANANAAITAVDTALTSVNTARSTLGAVQNRFQSTVANLQSISESTSSSRSQIQDADFAAETAAMSRAQILQQAGVSVLSQANAMPQSVLKLLG
ncbi:MAG: flagellin domain-containing protein, partial [Rhodanobacteraceae bacterium]